MSIHCIQKNSNRLHMRLFVTHPLATFHMHTNTPFRCLLWSKLSHLVKGQKFEQEASRQSRKNSLTQWYIVVFGGRFYNGVWDLWQCPFCLAYYSFHLKAESWDVRARQMWNRMRDFFFILEDVIKHYPLPAAVSQKVIVKSTYFSPWLSSGISRSWKSPPLQMHY